MNERERILQMVADHKLTVDEAAALLQALSTPGSPGADLPAVPDSPGRYPKASPKYLRVQITEHGQDKINIRVPVQLIRAGVQLGALLPPEVQQRMGEHQWNMNLGNIKPENIDAFIEGLSDLEVNVQEQADGVQIRVYSE